MVITIIVLLILAGISIAMLTGENGILTKANEAKTETAEAEQEEKDRLSNMEDLINEASQNIKVEKVTDSKPGVLEGSGTEEDPYTINSIEDLVVFSYNVREGNTYNGQFINLGLSLDFNSTKSYVNANRTDYGKYGYDGELKTLLTTGNGFIAIGKAYGDESGTNNFAGTFDGQNNKLINLYQNFEFNENRNRLGLFNYNYGSIKNLNLINVNINRTGMEGGLIGAISGQNRTDASIKNCTVTGKIAASGSHCSVSGITAHNMGTIEECINNADLSFNSTEILESGIGVAGISSSSSGIITKCANLGQISVNCILNGEYTGAITVGGINGYTGAGEKRKVEQCYNNGNIDMTVTCGEKAQLQLGGTIASTAAQVLNCYNTGNVILNTNNGIIDIGGLVGKYLDGITISNSYNVGKIQCIAENGTIYTGGIIARNNVGITNCYYINQEEFTNKNAGIIKSENEMKTQEFLNLLNSNQENVWKINSGINNGYPILSWQ